MCLLFCEIFHFWVLRCDGVTLASAFKALRESAAPGSLLSNVDSEVKMIDK